MTPDQLTQHILSTLTMYEKMVRIRSWLVKQGLIEDS